jgi:hypothetical protein
MDTAQSVSAELRAGRWYDFRRKLGIFLFTTASRTALASTQPPIQWVRGALSLGVRRPGREARHSPPSSAGQRMSRNIPPLPQYAFMEWWSVKKAEGQLYLYLYLYRRFCMGIFTCVCLKFEAECQTLYVLTNIIICTTNSYTG